MSNESLPEFPDAYLKPQEAFIYGKPGEWAIIIELEPFEHGGAAVKTNINFDSFPWDIAAPQELAETEHAFSREDREDGNIEGSIYLNHAHNPVDITQITFGQCTDAAIEARLSFEIDFDFEGGGFRNRAGTIQCSLQFKTPTVSHRVIR